ncbi:MAG: DUF1987 domain-containing protein [Bacteroidota bacterium]|nr:DUF1987 domain-containing protein [Bacteroidota bacterium]
MDSLLIDGTFTTPEVRFITNGNLYIGGRSLPEDTNKFYNPIFDWIKNFRGSSVTIDIRFGYLNTSSSKQLYTLLTLIKENTSVAKVLVNWYYEEGDDDYYEFGKEMEMLTKLDFDFYEYAETE